jgi:hypothetical protein
MPLTNLLDKTATITHADGTTPDLSSPPPCTIAPADLRTVMEYAQQGLTAVHLVYSASDLGAVAGDHVTIDGTTYPVVTTRSFANASIGPAIYVTVCGAAT